MTVSVVVPTRNRCEQLASTLTAVLADDAATEVVVVDDGSADGTAALVRARSSDDGRLVLVAGPQRGAGWARHAGAEAATGDLLVLLDDDVVPEPGLVAGHRAAHAGTAGLVVVGYMPMAPDLVDRPDAVAARIYAADYEGQISRYEAEPDSVLRDLWCGNISLGRLDALRIGLGDAHDLAYHEDKELGLRCLAAGLTGVFDRSLRAVHHQDRSFESFIASARASGRGRALLHRLHPEAEGPVDAYTVGRELPRPARLLVRAARVPLVADLELWALGRLVPVLGRPRLRRVQTGAAVLARSIATLQGAVS